MEKFSENIVLASSSPRRREILSRLGLCFDVIPADIDENAVDEKSPSKYVKKLSKLKAEAVKADGRTIIAADTTVYRRGKFYGKPHTEENAVKMLSELRGKRHSVYTGVTVACNGKSVTFAVKSSVKFLNMSDEEILAYVSECKPLDKAGAYGIQDKQVVEKYSGSYTNIVGLPSEKLVEVLRRYGVIDGKYRTVD